MTKKILLKGPLLSRSGYGEQSRFALRSLRSRPELFDIYIINTPWGSTGQIAGDSEEKRFINFCAMKAAQHVQAGGTFDISVQVTIPNEFEKIAPVNIGYTAGIETTKIAPVWIQKINEMVDKVIVVSNHSKKVLEQTTYDVKDQHGNTVPDWGVQVPVESVNYPVRASEAEEIELNLETDNNFLVISQWGPRKNLENTIKWFVEKFKDDDTVGLVLKTNVARDSITDREFTVKRLEQFLNTVPDRKCKVYLVHGDLTPGQLTTLYTHPTMKALINIGHGEGYGLPLFEAAYNGLPLITTTWSGQMDFITKPNKKGKNVPRVAAVDYDIKPVQKQAVWPGVIQEDAMWAYARETSFKRVLGEVLEKETHYTKEAETLKNHILENFTEEKMYREFVDAVSRENSGLVPQPVEGISFCISTNGAKPEKTKVEIKSIHKTMANVEIPYEIIVAGNTTQFTGAGIVSVHTPSDAENGLLAKLRNNAGEIANHDVLVFVDDDFIFPETWAERLVQYSLEEGWEVTANRILLPDGGRFWDRATFSPHKLVSYDHTIRDKALYQTGGFWVMRKSVYDNHKWDSTIPINSEKTGQPNEDIEMSMRMHANRISLCFDKDNLVWHDDDSYTEFRDQTLKKQIVIDKTGFSHFPDPNIEYREVVKGVR